MIYNTVGELRKALEGLDDNMPLASRGRQGGSWVKGSDIGTIELVTLGSGNSAMTASVEDDKTFWKNFKGKRGDVIVALAFD